MLSFETISSSDLVRDEFCPIGCGNFRPIDAWTAQRLADVTGLARGKVCRCGKKDRVAPNVGNGARHAFWVRVGVLGARIGAVAAHTVPGIHWAIESHDSLRVV